MKKLSASTVYLTESFVFAFAFRLAFTTYVIYRVRVLGLDPLQLVLAGTVLESTVFLFEIPTGIVADLYSRRLSTIIGFFCFGFGILIEGLAPLFSVLLFSQVVTGLGWTFTSGAYSAWITDEVGTDKVGQLFLRGSQLDNIGSLLAILPAIWIASYDLALPFLLGGGLLIAVAVFMLLFMPETNFTPLPKEEREGWRTMFMHFKAGLDMARGRQVLLIYALIALLIGLYSEAWDRLAQPFLLESYQFPNLFGYEMDAIKWFGLLNAAVFLIGILVTEIARRLVDTSANAKLLQALQLVFAGMVILMIVFALSGQFWLALVAMLLFNVLRKLSNPLANAWLNQHLDSKLRATMLSMTGQLDALGQLSGGPFLGFIGSLSSLRAALLASALTLAPVTALYRRIAKIQDTAE